jgi:hypothetical protein
LRISAEPSLQVGFANTTPHTSMKKYTFTATVQAADARGAFVFFPYYVQQEFGTAGKVPVQATFDGIPYRGSLIKYGHPQHMLGLLKDIRKQLGKAPGDSVEVVLWKDAAERTLEVPPALAERMDRAGVRAFFDSLSYTHCKEYSRWIAEAKKEETRLKRLDKAVAMLKQKVRTPG